MNKEFIPYEPALALKELGFDEPCFGRYYCKESYSMLNPNSGETELVFEFGQYIKQTEITILAPLYQQVFRWFREKHNIEGFIVPLISERKGISFEERVYEALIIFKGNKKIKPGFKTYEEAELDCLIKLIEIVKTK
jgi:hypothetical protein